MRVAGSFIGRQILGAEWPGSAPSLDARPGTRSSGFRRGRRSTGGRPRVGIARRCFPPLSVFLDGGPGRRCRDRGNSNPPAKRHNRAFDEIGLRRRPRFDIRQGTEVAAIVRGAEMERSRRRRLPPIAPLHSTKVTAVECFAAESSWLLWILLGTASPSRVRGPLSSTRWWSFGCKAPGRYSQPALPCRRAMRSRLPNGNAIRCWSLFEFREFEVGKFKGVPENSHRSIDRPDHAARQKRRPGQFRFRRPFRGRRPRSDRGRPTKPRAVGGPPIRSTHTADRASHR